MITPLFIFSLFSYKNFVLTSTFGEYRYGHIHSGIDIRANYKALSINNIKQTLIKKYPVSPFNFKPGGGNVFIVKDINYIYIFSVRR